MENPISKKSTIQKQNIIHFQYCTNCQSHNWNTHHNQAKYHQTYIKLRNLIQSYFQSNVPIIQANKVPNYLVPIKQKENKYYNPMTKKYMFFPNIGSFQITLNNQVIFSKKKTNSWPVFQNILSQISMKLYQRPLQFKQNIKKIQTNQTDTQFSQQGKNILQGHKTLYKLESKNNKKYGKFTLTDHFKSFHEQNHTKTQQSGHYFDSSTTIKQYPQNSIGKNINVQDIEGLRKALKGNNENENNNNSRFDQIKQANKENEKQILINLCSIQEQSNNMKQLEQFRITKNSYKKPSAFMNSRLQPINTKYNSKSIHNNGGNTFYSDKSSSLKRFQQLNNDLKKIERKFQKIQNKINRKDSTQQNNMELQQSRFNNESNQISKNQSYQKENNYQNKQRNISYNKQRNQSQSGFVKSKFHYNPLDNYYNLLNSNQKQNNYYSVHLNKQYTLNKQNKLSPPNLQNSQIKATDRYDERYVLPSYYQQNQLNKNAKSKKYSQIQKYLKANNQQKNKKLKKIYGDWKVGTNSLNYLYYLQNGKRLQNGRKPHIFRDSTNNKSQYNVKSSQKMRIKIKQQSQSNSSQISSSQQRDELIHMNNISKQRQNKVYSRNKQNNINLKRDKQENVVVKKHSSFIIKNKSFNSLNNNLNNRSNNKSVNNLSNNMSNNQKAKFNSFKQNNKQIQTDKYKIRKDENIQHKQSMLKQIYKKNQNKLNNFNKTVKTSTKKESNNQSKTKVQKQMKLQRQQSEIKQKEQNNVNNQQKTTKMIKSKRQTDKSNKISNNISTQQINYKQVQSNNQPIVPQLDLNNQTKLMNREDHPIQSKQNINVKNSKSNSSNSLNKQHSQKENNLITSGRKQLIKQHSRSSSLYQQPTYSHCLSKHDKNQIQPCKCQIRQEQQQTNRLKVLSQRKQKQQLKQKRIQQNKKRKELIEQQKHQYLKQLKSQLQNGKRINNRFSVQKQQNQVMQRSKSRVKTNRVQSNNKSNRVDSTIKSKRVQNNNDKKNYQLKQNTNKQFIVNKRNNKKEQQNKYKKSISQAIKDKPQVSKSKYNTKTVINKQKSITNNTIPINNNNVLTKINKQNIQKSKSLSSFNKVNKLQTKPNKSITHNNQTNSISSKIQSNKKQKSIKQVNKAINKLNNQNKNKKQTVNSQKQKENILSRRAKSSKNKSYFKLQKQNKVNKNQLKQQQQKSITKQLQDNQKQENNQQLQNNQQQIDQNQSQMEQDQEQQTHIYEQKNIKKNKNKLKQIAIQTIDFQQLLQKQQKIQANKKNKGIKSKRNKSIQSQNQSYNLQLNQSKLSYQSNVSKKQLNQSNISKKQTNQKNQLNQSNNKLNQSFNNKLNESRKTLNKSLRLNQSILSQQRNKIVKQTYGPVETKKIKKTNKNNKNIKRINKTNKTLQYDNNHSSYDNNSQYDEDKQQVRHSQLQEIDQTRSNKTIVNIFQDEYGNKQIQQQGYRININEIESLDQQNLIKDQQRSIIQYKGQRQKALILKQLYNLQSHLNQQLKPYEELYQSNNLYTKLNHNSQSNISSQKYLFDQLINNLNNFFQSSNKTNNIQFIPLEHLILLQNQSNINESNTQICLFGSDSIQINQLQSNSPFLTKNLHKVLHILCSKNQLLIVKLFQDFNSKTLLNYQSIINNTQSFKHNNTVISKYKYGVWLCINKIWKLIIVDNIIPVQLLSQSIQNGQKKFKPLFSYHSNNQFWPYVLQKSIAKAIGGYQKLFQLSVGQLFTMLTGCNYISYSINQNISKNKNFLKQISQNDKKNYVMVCQKYAQNMRQFNNKVQQNSKIYYLLSKKTIFNGQNQQTLFKIKQSLLYEKKLTKQEQQQAYYIRYEKFCQKFSKCQALHLRQHNNYSFITLNQSQQLSQNKSLNQQPVFINKQNKQTNKSKQSNYFYVIQITFQQQSYGTITVSNQYKSNFKTYLYKLQNYDQHLMKLVGQATKNNKNSLFFDCYFQINKYYLFIQSSNPNSVVAYMGQGKPQIKIKQQILSNTLKNQSIQYLPVSNYQKPQANPNPMIKTFQSNFYSSNVSFNQKPKNMDDLRQMFIDLLIQEKRKR